MDKWKIEDGGWKECFSAQTPPSPESCFYFHPHPSPNHPLYPLHFHSPTHSNRVAAALSSYTNIPTEKGQKTIYPLLLTILPSPLLSPQKRVSHLTFSLFASSLLFLPPISHIHTHTYTHRYEHTHTYKLNPLGQQLYMRWQIGVFVCLNAGGGTPTLHTQTHIHTHRAVHLYCRQVPLHIRQCTLHPMFKRRNMVLPLWEVENFSSLREWYRDREINREKDRECIRQKERVRGGKDGSAIHMEWMKMILKSQTNTI